MTVKVTDMEMTTVKVMTVAMAMTTADMTLNTLFSSMTHAITCMPYPDLSIT